MVAATIHQSILAIAERDSLPDWLHMSHSSTHRMCTHSVTRISTRTVTQPSLSERVDSHASFPPRFARCAPFPLRGRRPLCVSRFFLWLDETWLLLLRRGLLHKQELEYDLVKQETLVWSIMFGGVIGQWMFPTVLVVLLVHDWRVWASARGSSFTSRSMSSCPVGFHCCSILCDSLVAHKPSVSTLPRPFS